MKTCSFRRQAGRSSRAATAEDSLIEALAAQQQPSPEPARGRDQEDRERIPSRPSRARKGIFEAAAETLQRAASKIRGIPRGQVRRVAHDPALLRLSRTQQVADNDDPGRDAHMVMQRRIGGRLQLRRRLHDRKPRSLSALADFLVEQRGFKLRDSV